MGVRNYLVFNIIQAAKPAYILTKNQKVKSMSELFKAGQVLGRSEMKKIMAGSGCNSHKCCWDHNPSSCSQCRDVGSNGVCQYGSHLVSCCDWA